MAWLGSLVLLRLGRRTISSGGETAGSRHSSCDDDYESYVQLMAQFCKAHQVAVWAYCLMPNHVHMIGVPQAGDALRGAIGEANASWSTWSLPRGRGSAGAVRACPPIKLSRTAMR